MQGYNCNYTNINCIGQDTLPIRSTLLPILLVSDQTHLTNFSGNKKLWPVYLTLANIHLSICNKPQSQAWILVAFLPIPPKRVPNLREFSEAQQSRLALQVIHGAISYILSPLSNTETADKGLPILYVDETLRHCFLRLSTRWLADHMENCNIYGINTDRCITCLTPPNAFRDFAQEFPTRP